MDRIAPLILTSANQINYIVPAGTAPGLAATAVRRGNQVIATGIAHIHPVAPALFSANSTGQGAAAAFALHISPSGNRTQELVFQCGPVAGKL